MILSQAGIDFIEKWETFRPTAYLPTPNDKWTIGYGHTDSVKEGDTCTQDQANVWFDADCQWANEAVRQHVTVPLTQNQFDALVSLVFNIGKTNFEESTLLRNINDGKFNMAADPTVGFPAWRKQGKRVLPGLVARRAAELAVFQS